MIRSIGRWKKDSEAASCEDCQAAFGLLKRRHHCRSCGGIFCSGCSANTVFIALIDTKNAQRVCKICHARLRATAAPAKPQPSTPKRTPRPVDPPPCAPAETERQALVESKSGETDSESTRRNTAYKEEVPHPAGGDSSDSDGDDDLGPPQIDLNSMPHQSSHSLSFLSVLQDSLKQRDADNIVSVLIYAGEGKEQSMVTDVREGETMRHVSDRLAPLYFKLQHPPFRRMDDASLEALRGELRFYTEHQVVVPDTPADEVVAHCKKLVLSTLEYSSLRQLFLNSAVSGRSVRSFLRSDRSDRPQDIMGGSEHFDE